MFTRCYLLVLAFPLYDEQIKDFVIRNTSDYDFYDFNLNLIYIICISYSSYYEVEMILLYICVYNQIFIYLFLNSMKKQLLVLVSFILFSSFSFGQKFVQPSEGKSIVYFIWTHIKLSYEDELMVVNPDLGLEFSPMVQFFDGDKYLGKRNCYDYVLYYECDPGYHKFWIYGGLLKYLNSELLPNQVYLAFVPLPYLGTFLGGFSGYYRELLDEKFPNGIELLPINKDIDSFKYKGAEGFVLPLIEKNKHIELQELILSSRHKRKKIAEMNRKSEILYEYKTKHGEFIPFLGPEMYIELNK